MRCYPRYSSKSQNKSNKNKIFTDIPEGDIKKKMQCNYLSAQWGLCSYPWWRSLERNVIILIILSRGCHFGKNCTDARSDFRGLEVFIWHYRAGTSGPVFSAFGGIFWGHFYQKRERGTFWHVFNTFKTKISAQSDAADFCFPLHWVSAAASAIVIRQTISFIL